MVNVFFIKSWCVKKLSFFDTGLLIHRQSNFFDHIETNLGRARNTYLSMTVFVEQPMAKPVGLLKTNVEVKR